MPGSEFTALDGEGFDGKFRAFVHAPFKEDGDKDRNDTSFGLQITLTDGDNDLKAIVLGDLAYPTVNRIFERSDDEDLEFDVFLGPHHCSKSVMYWQCEGDDEETLQQALLDKIGAAARDDAYIVVSSPPVPASSKPGDNPPHAIAADRYRGARRRRALPLHRRAPVGDGARADRLRGRGRRRRAGHHGRGCRVAIVAARRGGQDCPRRGGAGDPAGRLRARVSVTPGQRQALRQIHAISAAAPGGLEVIKIVEPSDDRGDVGLDVSIDCSGFEHLDGGLSLRARERLLLFIPAGFPFSRPEVWTRHDDGRGHPTCNGGRTSASTRRRPSNGFPATGCTASSTGSSCGCAARRAVARPRRCALHPPAVYRTAGTPLVIARADTPLVHDEPWLGWVTTEHHGDARVNLTAWTPIRNAAGKYNTPPKGAAAAFLLPTQMNWEYPKHAVVLLMALVDRGVAYGDLMFHLKLSALAIDRGAPLLVVVGTAMRGTQGGERRQHLAVWRLPGDAVDLMRRALGEYVDDDELRAAGKEAHQRTFEYLRDAKIEWCDLREDRPEVVIRRDDGSPMQAFAEKKVMVWGCGALGAPVAESVVRAGAARVIVVDSAPVTPGILVRQPFADADIGKPKAEVLAERLRAIRPGIDVTPHVGDILRLLDRDTWHYDADVIVDCSANLSVQTKLGLVARERPATVRAHVACLLLGHTAQHGLGTIASPGHAGTTADVLRSAKLACLGRPELRGFADEFWPRTPRSEHFQPEPGCSDATFRGSGAEATALAGTLLTCLARDLRATVETATATAHLVSLPGADHTGAAAVRLAFDSPLVAQAAGGEYEIRIAPAAARELRSWIAAAARRLGAASETGGLIFGQRDEATGALWVERLSGPPPDSIETPAEFLCGTEGVPELCEANARLGRGSLEFLGMWHTHPDQSSAPSHRDLLGMAQLSAAAPSPLAQGLIIIVGHARGLAEEHTAAVPDVSAYVFDSVAEANRLTIEVKDAEPVLVPTTPPARPRDVGIALSGGGSRAIAFHLGCLRALHDRGVLDRVAAVSGVSGGSVLTALFGYFDDDFTTFDARTCELLRRGLHGSIARRALLSPRLPQAAATRVVAGTAAGAARAVGFTGRKLGRHTAGHPPLRRWASRTDAFVDVLDKRIFQGRQMSEVARTDLGVVINACDLTTGSAFRFGSRESGTWRVGRVVDNDVRVAEAVGASAAYPLLLPALDRKWRFTPMHGGPEFDARVVLTDGGVFDNLGTSCLEPGRSEQFSTNVYDVEYIIACDAGRGLLDSQIPFGPVSRLSRSFLATFRKAQDATRARLHQLVEHGDLQGFVMPYLGQRDSTLPYMPPDLITRQEIADYPTDFAAMSDETIALLAGRGEQLTRMLIDRWCPEL